ncbi:MAG: NYN domain-containing protein, partial [Pedococcus sp.]
MDPRARIALLIDADNSSAKKLDHILGELSKLGETSIRRAYGNWTKPGLRPWTELLHANAILPMQQFDYSRGKNASDMAMVVDAM